MTIPPEGASVQSVADTIDELSRWFISHPEDHVRRTDRDFLFKAFQESLRLHPVGLLFRQATTDMTLKGGARLRAGQWAVLRIKHGNRDNSVFGPDAEEFRPW